MAPEQASIEYVVLDLDTILKLFQARFVPGGLYLLDEPEAPLSPIRQLALIAAIKDMVAQNGQFIIATHSPILMAFPGLLRRYLPILTWGAEYSPRTLASDLVAAAIVSIMLIPQSLAYALMVGLPPQVGLYASMAPLALYAIFGSSRALAVGPVAVASLMTAAAVAPLAAVIDPAFTWGDDRRPQTPGARTRRRRRCGSTQPS